MDENQGVTAEDQVNGADNGAKATEKETVKETQTGQNKEQTFTQSDVDRRVQEALNTAKNKWNSELDGKLEAAKNEGARLAKLSAEERQKEADKAEREKFEQEKAEFAHKSLVAETVKQLGEKGIPVEFAEMAAGADAKEAQANIKMLEKAWNEAVENAVTKRLSSKAPNVGTNGNVSTSGGFFETIRENKRI